MPKPTRDDWPKVIEALTKRFEKPDTGVRKAGAMQQFADLHQGNMLITNYLNKARGIADTLGAEFDQVVACKIV